MKQFLSLLLTVVLAVSLLTGCGGGESTVQTSPSADQPQSSETPAAEPEASAQEPAAEGVTEIRAAWWGDTNRFELYDKIVAEFQKAHPEVQVRVEPTSWNDYWDKMAVQTAGGNAPDFIGMHPQYSSDYIGRDLVEPLDAYIADGTLDLSGFPQSVIDTGVVDGVNYMVAMGITYSSSFVNKGVFDRLGVEVPEFAWTWDDVKTKGLEVREAMDAEGLTTSWMMNDASTNINFFRYFVRQHGTELYLENGDLGATKEIVEEWFAMYNEFRELGIIPDAATATEYASAVLEDSLFSREKALVVSVPINQYGLYHNTFEDLDMIAVRNPSYSGGSVGEYPEGAHFAVFSKSSDEKKLAAVKLLNFWVNADESLSLFLLDQGVPGNTEKTDVITPYMDDKQLYIMEFVNTLNGVSTPTVYPPVGASEIDAVFKNIAEQVSFGATEPGAAAEDFVTQAQAIIEKNRS